MNLTCLKSGIWQAELRVPQEVRPVIGKTRFAKSTGTRNKREAVLRAAPLLEQWLSDIELAKSDPQTLIAKQAQRKAQQVIRPLSQESGVPEDHLAWLRGLPPSKASKYEAIDWGSGIPLPAHMEAFIQSHYTKPDTQSEARRYVLEATAFMPTLESLTKLNAQRWLTEEEGKEPLLTVHDSYVIQSQCEQELIDQMVYATKAEIGDFYFKKKQEKLSPTVVATFARMDNQINLLDGYQSIADSIVRTEGYKIRYERFVRYPNDYHPDG